MSFRNGRKSGILHNAISYPIRYNYTMHGQTLELVENTLYLDVYISSCWGFSHHTGIKLEGDVITLGVTFFTSESDKNVQGI